MPYLYRHLRLDSDMPFYIGIGRGYRAWQKTNRSRYWERIVQKYGFSVEIMLDGLTWEEAQAKEKEFIALYGRKDKGTGFLINMTDGGDGMLGFIPTEKMRKSASERAKGNKYTLGRKLSPEHKAATGRANLGNKHCVGRVLSCDTKNKIKIARARQPATNAKGVVQYDLSGMFVAEYASANDAGRKTGFYAYLITAACRNKKNGKAVYKKFAWKYLSEVKEDGIIKKNIILNKDELYNSDPFLKRIAKKLNEQGVIEIRKSNLTPLELSRKFGVSRTTIYGILNFEQWILLKSDQL